MEPQGTNSSRQTMEQRRAKAAWALVHKKSLDESVVKGAPAMIQSAGLGQAMAFNLAKGRGDFVDCMAAWLLKEDRWGGDFDITKDYRENIGKTLMQKITEVSAEEYRRYTMEAMAFLVWMKRFTEAKNQ